MITLIILFYLIVGIYTGARRGLTLQLVYIAGYFRTRVYRRILHHIPSCDVHLRRTREVLIGVHPISIIHSWKSLSDFHRSPSDVTRPIIL